MRKLLLTMLLATAVTPALADPGDGHRFGRRGEQGEPADRADRAERAERARPRDEPRAEAPRVIEQRPVDVQPPRGNGFGGSGSVPQARPQGQWNQGEPRSNNMMQRYRDRREQGAPVAPGPVQPQPQPQPPVGGGRWVDHVRDGTQPRPTLPVDANGAPHRWDGHRDQRGDWRGNDGRNHDWRNQAGRRDNHDRDRWSNEWHRDPRYDWQRYRQQNRFVFQLGVFNDPFGYGYRPLGIGYTLYSGYYQPNYWLQDPWQYRLPPAYGRYRWVRYYDDALLVDIYSGRIVDSIRDFFW